MTRDSEPALGPGPSPPPEEQRDYACEIRWKLPTAKTAREAEVQLEKIMEYFDTMPPWLGELVQAEVYTY